MTTVVQIRDSALRRVAETDDFTELDLTVRYNDLGAWKLVLPANSAAAMALTFAGGIVVTRNGQVLLSGPVTALQRDSSNGRAVLTATGTDDLDVLRRRLALPAPAVPGSGDTDAFTGHAEDALRYYVDRNAGPAAVTGRRYNDLTLPVSAGLGQTVIGSARYDNLLALLQSLAGVGQVGFRVVQVGVGRQFQVYSPADRTRTAVFGTDLGNLISSVYSTVAPSATFAYVAGSGVGAARVVRTRVDSTGVATFGRAEVFVDQRNTGATAELDQAGDAALLEQSASSTLQLQPIDTPTLAFGRDYNLGDRVAADVDGVRITDVLRQVRLTITAADGERITPTLASDGASLARLNIFDALRRTARRLSLIERQ